MDESEILPPVTVLGLGAMGRALATAFVSRGHPTTVWNRSPGRGGDVVARGAVEVDDVRDAVAASPLIVVCVLDPDAVRSALGPARDLLAGRSVVNLTSSTPEAAREVAEWVGGDYLDGAIMVPTPLIGGPDAVVLYSGSPSVHASHRSTLAAIGGTGEYLGDDPGWAALHDLGLLGIFFTAMTSFLHAAALLGADGVRAADLVPHAERIVSILPATFAQLARDVDAGTHPGDEDRLVMDKAALDHIAEASATRGVDPRLPAGIADVLARAIERGHGEDGFSRVIDELRAVPAVAR